MMNRVEDRVEELVARMVANNNRSKFDYLYNVKRIKDHKILRDAADLIDIPEDVEDIRILNQLFQWEEIVDVYRKDFPTFMAIRHRFPTWFTDEVIDTIIAEIF